MQAQWLAHVGTVVCDPVHANRHLTRNALFTLGFRDIEAIVTLTDARRVLDVGDFDLFLLDVTSDEAAACALIRDIRSGTVGRNPFIVIIATTWNQSADLVRHVIESGADDLIVRPLSTGTLKTRIRQQVEARKSFVVTSSYIGPDRRRDAARGPSEGLINVPNTLRLKAHDGVLTGADPSAISDVRRKIERRRVEKDAFHIGLTCQLLEEELAHPDPACCPLDEVASLREAARDLASRAVGQDFGQIVPLCVGMTEAVAELDRAFQGTQPAQEAAKPLALLTQFSRAVLLALDADKDEASLIQEIGATVEQIKARRAISVPDDGRGPANFVARG